MPREDMTDLMAFLAVAEDRSFTKAAARLGVSQSALSHTVRRLEARLGVRLLARTTRSVSATEAGERLLGNIGPRFAEIEAELQALNELRDRPAGSIRINSGEHAANSLIWPRLQPFLRRYPDIKLELSIDNGLVDIVEQRFDAGVRLGEQIAKDMIAVRIGPDWRFAAVASPDYFARYAKPLTPDDLTEHDCINLRLRTYGGLYAWEFARDGRPLNVHVTGRLTFSSTAPALAAALEGFGLANVPEDMVDAHIREGRLVRVLEDWTPSWVGYHLYYPSRRQVSPAFALLVDALRYPGRP